MFCITAFVSLYFKTNKFYWGKSITINEQKR